MRLIDMGVEGYLAAASLRAVIAQRLVRRVVISAVQTMNRMCRSGYYWNQ